MSEQSNQSTAPGRRELPVDLPGLRAGGIPLPADFGLDAFIDAIAAAASDAARTNPHTAAERVRSALRSWILGFETDAATIRQRQDVVRTFRDRPALSEVVQDLDIAPYDPNQESRGGYQYHLERFESYAEALTSLRAALDDSLPDWLIGVRSALDDAAAEASGAAGKLNPRLALEVSLSGRVHISKRESLLGGTTQQGRLSYTYALINESTGESLERGTPGGFGVGDVLNPWDPAPQRRSAFEYQVDSEIFRQLTRVVKESIFTRVFHLSGVIGVDEAAGVAKSTVFFRRTSREPLLKVIANNAVGFIPGAARLGYAWESLKPSVVEGTLYVEISAEPTGAMQDENTLFRILEKVRSDHNLFYLRQFPPAIRRFERLLVTLKAVAAAVRFFRGLQARGTPVTFPTVVHPASDAPTHIHGLVPPELAVLPAHDCVPSDVQFSPRQPTVLITGANNNGKTTYLDSIGITQALFQAGLPILASEAALEPRDKILSHFIRPGDVQAGESTFAHECSRAVRFVEQLTHRSLALCDELFRGTSPQDGLVVSELALRCFMRSGAAVFFVTHYHGLVQRLNGEDRLRFLACKLDHSVEPARYTYRMQPGVSTESDGLLVAAQHGFSAESLDRILAFKASRGEIPESI
ncbi:MAG: hypothetical protein OXG65_17120 [Chloroflexi bacterium]|nr:hypothetical protein [Chloroflexota bacterium]